MCQSIPCRKPHTLLRLLPLSDSNLLGYRRYSVQVSLGIFEQRLPGARFHHRLFDSVFDPAAKFTDMPLYGPFGRTVGDFTRLSAGSATKDYTSWASMHTLDSF